MYFNKELNYGLPEIKVGQDLPMVKPEFHYIFTTGSRARGEKLWDINVGNVKKVSNST